MVKVVWETSAKSNREVSHKGITIVGKIRVYQFRDSRLPSVGSS